MPNSDVSHQNSARDRWWFQWGVERQRNQCTRFNSGAWWLAQPTTNWRHSMPYWLCIHSPNKPTWYSTATSNMTTRPPWEGDQHIWSMVWRPLKNPEWIHRHPRASLWPAYIAWIPRRSTILSLKQTPREEGSGLHLWDLQHSQTIIHRSDYDNDCLLWANAPSQLHQPPSNTIYYLV